MPRTHPQCPPTGFTVLASPAADRAECDSADGRLPGAVNLVWLAFLGLCLLLTSCGIGAQTVRPIITTPWQPVAGDRIEVAFDSNACELIIDGPGDAEIVRTGVAIDVIVDGRVESDPLFCNIPPGRPRFVLGSLAPGRYAVRIVVREFLPPFFLYPPSAAGTIIVNAAPVPAIGIEAVGALFVLLLLGGWFAMKRRGTYVWMVMVAVLFGVSMSLPKSVRAQVAGAKPVFITLRAAGTGGPTPEMVVEQWSFSSGAFPPLLGLSASETAETGYLLPVRASGRFLSYLLANPDSSRAALERTIIVWYVPSANVANALASLRSDPNVLSASEPLPFEYPVPVGTASALPTSTAGGTQTWVDAMSLTGAWALAGGWSLVGVLDNGLATSHPDLVAVGANNGLTGGNFLTAYAMDNGRYIGQQFPLQPGVIDFDVDERQPVAVPIPPLQESANPCDPNRTGFIQPAFAGHGSHVAGLIAASHANADGTVGACKNCGIAMTRNSLDTCNFATGTVRPTLNQVAIIQAITYLVDNGAQVVNGSFGIPAAFSVDCANSGNATLPECRALRYASENGVVMIAASGNSKATLNWPARDPRVVAVGGLTEDNATFWENRNDLPNTSGGCPVFNPPAGPNAECGSNFSQTPSEPKQGLVAQARNVFSLSYPGANWNNTVQCGDSFGSALGDGRGICTGTSMSAPLVAGIAGILRSVNPLVMPGDPETSNDALGIRDALIAGGLPPGLNAWDPRFGYGRVIAVESVRAMLGTSRATLMRNRLTPLFAMYSELATDWAYVTVPQAAAALMVKGLGGPQGLIDGRVNDGDWRPQGAPVRGYPAFPMASPPELPRADIYVLTTEYRVDPGHPPLVPLYWLDRLRHIPSGCTPGPGCDFRNRDFLLMTSSTEVTSALNDGYTYRGLQGYVYQRCTPEPTCIPAGAEALYRKCNVARDDCAIFLERQRTTFEAQGYTATYPSGTPVVIGYAYPAVHSDNDALIDAQEILLGTRIDATDSDRDGTCDDVEYPVAAIPVSDPCSNGQCSPFIMFADGFETRGVCPP
jgi:serine protease